MANWSKEELNKAISLLKSGLNHQEIGDKLGRSYNSVRNKLNGEGYKVSDYKKKEYTCKQCKNSFTGYRSKDRKFCSKSCSAKYSNRNRADRSSYNNCKRCNEKTKNPKFCSEYCCHEFKREQRDTQIEKDKGVGHSSTTIKSYLIRKYGNECMECGWNKKNKYSGNIPIELNHIDGNSENNHLNNLELLCPNCHSLTKNYKALNTGNGRHYRRKRYKEGKSY